MHEILKSLSSKIQQINVRFVSYASYLINTHLHEALCIATSKPTPVAAPPPTPLINTPKLEISLVVFQKVC